jgi:crotonobetainyl-CoA:carnitine CoA-transferase CaiB-like acyl-CoA transferase
MTEAATKGPLAGLRVVEMAGIGPAPMCGMLLSDLGAEIIRIDRPTPSDLGISRPLDTNFNLRGRDTIKLDLKDPGSTALVLALVGKAACLIEGFRPGVMERLGLGPEPCLARNPSLVYGRVTGWGQDGPLANSAGHDLNYIALTGALEAMGRSGERPPVPLNLIGDFAGGALFLGLGLLAGVFEARRSGRGQVVDAAMVDGVAAMMNSIRGFRAAGVFSTERGANVLDSGAYFYDVYRCADGRFIAVGAIEKRFFDEFLARLSIDPAEMPPQEDRSRWAEGRERLQRIFLTRTRDEWAARFEGSDACVSPVLSVEESTVNQHMRSRGTYIEVDGHVQAGPAPRFSRTVPETPGPPQPAGGVDALNAWLDEAEREALGASQLLK